MGDDPQSKAIAKKPAVTPVEKPASLTPKVLDPEQQQHGQEIEAWSSSEYFGPLPPPELMAAFEKALPGTGNALIDDFQKNSQHERDMDVRQMSAAEKDQAAREGTRTRAQWMTFALSVLALAVVAYAIFIGTSAAVLLGVVLASALAVVLAGSFAWGKYVNFKLEQEKLKIQIATGIRTNDDGGDDVPEPEKSKQLPATKKKSPKRGKQKRR